MYMKGFCWTIFMSGTPIDCRSLIQFDIRSSLNVSGKLPARVSKHSKTLAQSFLCKSRAWASQLTEGLLIAKD